MTQAFIVGSDRSGTTLLRLAVNEHPDLAVPAETWFLIDLIDVFGVNARLDSNQIDRAIEIVTAKRRWKNFSVAPSALRETLVARSPVGLAQFFEVLMTLEIASSGKPRWIDKTPEYVLHLQDLAELFPSARFINISRDGRDVFTSLRKQRWRGRTPLRIGRYWASCIDAASHAAAMLSSDRWLWITYEDLVNDMALTMREVCDFLGVPFEGGMVDFHRSATDHITPQALERGFHSKLSRPPDPSDVYRWKQGRSGYRSWLFEATAVAQLEAAGYETRMSASTARLLLPLVYGHHFGASVLAKASGAVRRARRRKGRRQ